MNTYFMQKPRLFAASLGVVALALLPSCQDEDFGYTAEQIKYAKNFTEKYGEIPADKSWDLTTWAQMHGNNSFSNTDETRATKSVNSGPLTFTGGNPDYVVSNEEYEVDSDLMEWMKDNLEEGRDNRSLGSSFMLRLPDIHSL